MDDLQDNLDCIFNQSAQGHQRITNACAAFHTKWMRAEFIAKPHNGMVKLLFVDFGTIDYVSTESIRFLVSDLCSIPRKRFRVTVDLIVPTNEDEMDRATLLFCELVTNGSKSIFGVVTNIDENNTATMIIVDTSLPDKDIIVNQLLQTSLL